MMPTRALALLALAPLFVACASGASAEPGSGAATGTGGAAGAGVSGSGGNAGDAAGAGGGSGTAGKGNGGSGASSGSKGTGGSGAGGSGGSGATGGSGNGGSGNGGSSAGAGGSSAGAGGGGGKGGAAGGGTAGSSGAAGGGGASGSGGATSCPTDPHEPNDTVGQSKNLPDSTDCDGDGGSFSGVLDGLNDQDWFAVHFSDKSTCTVDRAITITASMGMRVCIFFKPDNGGMPTIKCPAGSVEMGFAVPGYDGCCTNDKSLSVSYGSGGSDDSANVLFEVSSLDPTVKCGDYTVAYHF